MSSRLDSYLAALNTQFDAAEARLDQLQTFAAKSEMLRVVGESADGIAKVTVDNTGHMVDLSLSPDVTRLDPDRIAHAILEANAQAKRRLSFEVEQAAREAYGPDVHAAADVLRSYRERFGYEEGPR